jgi:hypothetical protein
LQTRLVRLEQERASLVSPATGARPNGNGEEKPDDAEEASALASQIASLRKERRRAAVCCEVAAIDLAEAEEQKRRYVEQMVEVLQMNEQKQKSEMAKIFPELVKHRA